MWKSRTAIIKKKPKIILDKRFPVVSQLNLGDRGQLLMRAIVESERLEFQEDDVERIIKTVRAVKIELLDNRALRT